MNKSGSRIYAVDFIKALAIICVVICHATENAYPIGREELFSLSAYGKLLALSLFTIGRLGVPLFFFSTGFLLLDREYTKEKAIHFYKNNLLGLVLTTEIWIFIYNILSLTYLKSINYPDADLKFYQIIYNALFLKYNLTHMWFMFAIIGIYAALPFVANGLRSLDIKCFKPLLCIIFIFLFSPSIINVFARVNGFDPIYHQLDFSFSGGCYGFMCVMGYAVKNGIFKKVGNYVWSVLAVAGFVVTVLLQFYSNINNVAFGIWYDSAPLVLASFSIFNLCIKIKGGIFKNFFSLVGRLSFGIYLIHNIFVIILNHCVNGVNPFCKMIILFIAPFSISLFITAVICRSKKLGRILFFMK